MNLQDKIKLEKGLIEGGNPPIGISRACRLNDGILPLNPTETKTEIDFFDQVKDRYNICFFVPASGSGSRMFSFLHDFLGEDISEKSIELTEHFINQISEFAFFNKLPYATKKALKSGDYIFEDLIEFLLNPSGFNFTNIPKGLVPFHKYGNFMISALQEHLLQGSAIAGESVNYHFTINKAFENEIQFNVDILEAITGLNYQVQFSEQDPETNSIAFDLALNPCVDSDNAVITRPSGHGALLKNINQIKCDFIFIRNIDNVQHRNQAFKSLETRKILCAKSIKIQAIVHDILHKIDNSLNFDLELNELIENYGIQLEEENKTNREFLKMILNRPIRVCGMVANEGQPGGGPFWVKNKLGFESPQIIEKSQISHQPEQLKLVVKSTHFNPVEIVCATKNYKGEKFNFMHFADESQYFVVKKSHEGKEITFLERPGLWNGGMANWLTVFYEIDRACFSPVKTVLDLLKPAHNA